MKALRDAAGSLIVTNVEWFIRILLGLAVQKFRLDRAWKSRLSRILGIPYAKK